MLKLSEGYTYSLEKTYKIKHVNLDIFNLNDIDFLRANIA